MTKRRNASIAAILALSVAFPAAASARTVGNAETGLGEPVGAALEEGRSPASSNGGFAWDDAGVGAGGALLVAGAAAGFAGTLRSRSKRGRRLSVGSS